VYETEADVAALGGLLDRSYAAAGRHLLSIHTPGRRLDAAGLAGQLQGMCLLALATVSADGRPFVGARSTSAPLPTRCASATSARVLRSARRI
jgi:hypothetical protein